MMVVIVVLVVGSGGVGRRYGYGRNGNAGRGLWWVSGPRDVRVVDRRPQGCFQAGVRLGARELRLGQVWAVGDSIG